MNTVYRPLAIKATITKYENGNRSVRFSTENANLLKEIENGLALNRYGHFTVNQLLMLHYVMDEITGKETSSVGFKHAGSASREQLEHVFEYVNEGLGCTNPSGSVEVIDESGALPPYLQLSQTLERMAHGVQEDCWAEHNKRIVGGEKGIDKSTLARAESICDHAIGLVKRLRDYKANLEPSGSLLDDEV